MKKLTVEDQLKDFFGQAFSSDKDSRKKELNFVANWIKNELKKLEEQDDNQVQKIIETCADYFDVSTIEMRGKSRKDTDLADAREIAQYLIFTDMRNAPISLIVREFSSCHSTVKKNIESVQFRIKKIEKFRVKVEAILNLLK